MRYCGEATDWRAILAGYDWSFTKNRKLWYRYQSHHNILLVSCVLLRNNLARRNIVWLWYLWVLLLLFASLTRWWYFLLAITTYFVTPSGNLNLFSKWSMELSFLFVYLLFVIMFLGLFCKILPFWWLVFVIACPMGGCWNWNQSWFGGFREYFGSFLLRVVFQWNLAIMTTTSHILELSNLIFEQLRFLAVRTLHYLSRNRLYTWFDIQSLPGEYEFLFKREHLYRQKE